MTWSRFHYRLTLAATCASFAALFTLLVLR